ncbi:MAG: methionyl-tRNA formyltransferase [Candidatus Sungbacteria bacterium RIFCSPLOWO2_02_FULL_51_17]|uniref:Methionyl-tRNA formyltransferase n=1 Tax=Candidatus Sungbacteria bacterium RIFCSPHIGHO2_02_FULL_51_29 TaxID=1802273 RepID=A0A1G2KS16_9BACT|nr:MAG: methionyl-tRNA formyltransferase [Candidatus Sungbacteria bacterium RIFCSPHIGHO2_01_FULL_51_22]OHA02190.1 MAG: methionyl-tRNA formyltransferase [Candidatus Sungbacteria bacterium RIFCSPHIGHO2_02_FULL_51_29]OHA07651.1 MAG: methionyl-tRNA formyltransferase [Candidatus Sungbacteria bacterium RIFCSPLOWO2_01_FULL_51_34]OHA10736.1 MAG: methionyl-tRNA formyltransferase [Candidatus Sungbacteria bacterium RIFCSPLOWO2_02_FULL_51_17]
MDNPAHTPSLVFWGTPDFSVPILTALAEHFRVVAIVTAPDRLAGRKNIITPPPIKKAGRSLGIPVLQPEKLLPHICAEIPPADITVVAAYGKILPDALLKKPIHGCLNVHPSLLPRWRGPSPIQAAFLAGDEKTGVSIMLMDEKMDHGPIIARQEIIIGADTVETLSKKLSLLSAEMLCEIIPRWIAGRIVPSPQNHEKATYCKIIKKADGKIVWSASAVDIERHIRAYEGWPGGYTFWVRKKTRLQLAIRTARLVSDPAVPVPPPGTITVAKDHMYIGTGNGALEVLMLRPEGGRDMSASSFMRGHPEIQGAVLE